MVGATTQGPVSAVVPLILTVALATLVARSVEPRSIYDARLTDAELRERLRARSPALA